MYKLVKHVFKKPKGYVNLNEMVTVYLEETDFTKRGQAKIKETLRKVAGDPALIITTFELDLPIGGFTHRICCEEKVWKWEEEG